MENENLRFYEKLRTPEKWAVKEIKAGRLAGKSDISPQWRIKAITQAFGPVGFGWKFTIEKLWTEPANEGQLFCFAHISFYYKDGEKWSEPIPAVGGDTLIEQEGQRGDRYLHANDEGYKMAITDALGKAMTYLGVAADIYENRYDTKHERKDLAPSVQQPTKTAQKPAGATAALRPASQVGKPATASARPTDAQQKVKKCIINEQVRFIADLIKQKNITKEQFEIWIFRQSNIKGVWNIPAQDFEGICQFISDDPATIIGTAAAGQAETLPSAGSDNPWDGNK